MSALIDTTAALRVLTGLAAAHPDLPAPTMQISGTEPSAIHLGFHDAPGSLYLWLDALGITAKGAESHVSADSSLCWLIVRHEIDGVRLDLTSYMRLAPAQEGEGAA
ncbi:hypothetical protein [Streptomyces sp. NPDC056061]|uniref:hypothetical protein n=1 Tax=Streptomyces sp. NPDC056061 TaxID=3345700 RepID=UPI0035D98192